jgi:Ca2+-binding EF-hand superfamily protein
MINLGEFLTSQEEVENVVHKIFEKYDTNRDNRLSFDEFKAAGVENPRIISAFLNPVTPSKQLFPRLF